VLDDASVGVGWLTGGLIGLGWIHCAGLIGWLGSRSCIDGGSIGLGGLVGGLIGLG